MPAFHSKSISFAGRSIDAMKRRPAESKQGNAVKKGGGSGKSPKAAGKGGNSQDAKTKGGAEAGGAAAASLKTKGGAGGEAGEKKSVAPPAAIASIGMDWEGALTSDIVALLYSTCAFYHVDLDAVFTQYAAGKEEMTASQLYQLFWDAQLIDGSTDVNAFFVMAIDTGYKGELRVSFEQFQGALARIFETLAVQRDLNLVRACDIMVRDHITPVTDPTTMTPKLQAFVPEPTPEHLFEAGRGAVVTCRPEKYALPIAHPAYSHNYVQPGPGYGYPAPYMPHPGYGYAVPGRW